MDQSTKTELHTEDTMMRKKEKKLTSETNETSYRSPLEESRREAAILRARRNRKRKKEQIESLQENVERLGKINQELVCQTQVLGMQLMNARCTIMTLEKMLQQQQQPFPYSNNATTDSTYSNVMDNTTNNNSIHQTMANLATVNPGLFCTDPSNQFTMMQSLQQQQQLQQLLQSNPTYLQALTNHQQFINSSVGDLNPSKGMSPSTDIAKENLKRQESNDSNASLSTDEADS
jgi:hypothetical protein